MYLPYGRGLKNVWTQSVETYFNFILLTGLSLVVFFFHTKMLEYTHATTNIGTQTQVGTYN